MTGAARSSGYLLIDKPAGMSSFAAVHAVRRSLGIGGKRGLKAGHAGTLDPFATGLLVVAIGKASRLLRWCVGHDKQYVVSVALGGTSTTDDVTGEITQRSTSFPPIAAVRAAVERVAQRREQIPASVSAVHIDGERAYRRVRRGETVDIPARSVQMAVTLISYDQQSGMLELDVSCSAGTYMRALARDIGEELAVGGYASSLRRTAVGHWSVSDAVTLDAVTWEHVMEPHGLVPDMPHCTIQQRRAFLHGQAIPIDRTDCEVAVVCDGDGEMLGVAEIRAGVLRPRVVISDLIALPVESQST